MKRATVLISLLLVVILAISAGCVSSQSDRQLARIEAQLQALTTTLGTTQQELASTKKALTDAQEKTRLVQQQLQDAQQAQQTVQTTSSTTYQVPAVQTISITPDYTPYYNPNPYPYFPSSPPLPPSFPPFHHPSPPPAPFPPAPCPTPPVVSPGAPFLYNGSIVWPNGWGPGMNKVETYNPNNPAHGRIFYSH
jgi:hypothetical protein